VYKISLATYYSTKQLNQKTSVDNRGNEHTSLLRTQTLFWTVFRVMSTVGFTTSCKHICPCVNIRVVLHSR